MERLKERLESSKKALKSFNEALLLPLDKIVRDATIQRFEFTMEAVWKLAQLYLRENEGLEIASPKGVMRGCFQIGLINEEQTHLALDMTNDRNLTVHTYNETLAEQIYSHLPRYFELMSHLCIEIDKRVNT
jgi:nucleotidyltransferase substrate binding protein (TIGR01987 family)